MTKQTNADELLIEELKERYCFGKQAYDGYENCLDADHLHDIIYLIRQHDNSQRNDVIDLIKDKVLSLKAISHDRRVFLQILEDVKDEQ